MYSESCMCRSTDAFMFTQICKCVHARTDMYIGIKLVCTFKIDPIIIGINIMGDNNLSILKEKVELE